MGKKISEEEKTEYFLNRRNPYSEKAVKSVFITIPFIPPSVNDLYYTRGGKRGMTTEGKVFKRKVSDYIVTNYLHEIQKLNSKALFTISLTFYLPPYDLFTKGYGIDETTKSPFKKRDVGNMEKIIIDCVKDLIIEDDCQFFQETLRKVPSDERKVEIQIYEEDPLYFLNSIRDTSLTGDILIKLDTYRNEI